MFYQEKLMVEIVNNRTYEKFVALSQKDEHLNLSQRRT